MNVGDWVRKRALLEPELQIIVTDDGKEFTYGEFDLRVNRVANSLQSMGIKRGERVAVLFPNNPEFLEVLFATAKIGAIMVPLNFRLSPPELSYILNDSGAQILMYTPEFSESVNEVRKLETPVERFISVGDVDNADAEYEQLISGFSDDEPEVEREVTLDDPLFIMYTSGTTGRPKGAVITHGNTQWNAINGVLLFRFRREKETCLVCAPMFHIGALSAVATPTIYGGGKLVLCRFFIPDRVLEVIEKHKVTIMFGIPVMYQLMAMSERFEKTDFSSIRYFSVGGAPCPVPIIEKYLEKGVTFIQGYGLTETAPAVTALEEKDALRKKGSAGRPLFHVDIRIVDENDNEVPQGELGEIVVKGPNVFKEYWNKPEETRQAIRGGWFHTGDIGRIDEEGYLYILDRKKDMIISGGENIYPAEVEDVIHSHPGVEDVGVIGIPDEKWGEVPIAIIVPVEGAKPTEEEIIEFCRGKLARYKTPKKVIFTDELPRTPTGKILKKELRAKYLGES